MITSNLTKGDLVIIGRPCVSKSRTGTFFKTFTFLDSHRQRLVVKFHSYNPEYKGKGDNSQKIHIEGQVTAVPSGIPSDVGEIGKG